MFGRQYAMLHLFCLEKAQYTLRRIYHFYFPVLTMRYCALFKRNTHLFHVFFFFLHFPSAPLVTANVSNTYPSIWWLCTRPLWISLLANIHGTLPHERYPTSKRLYHLNQTYINIYCCQGPESFWFCSVAEYRFWVCFKSTCANANFLSECTCIMF